MSVCYQEELVQLLLFLEYLQIQKLLQPRICVHSGEDVETWVGLHGHALDNVGEVLQKPLYLAIFGATGHFQAAGSVRHHMKSSLC